MVRPGPRSVARRCARRRGRRRGTRRGYAGVGGGRSRRDTAGPPSPLRGPRDGPRPRLAARLLEARPHSRRVTGRRELDPAGALDGGALDYFPVVREGIDCACEPDRFVAHLVQRLGDDADDLVVVNARRELVELSLDEDEAERVLERLYFGVLAETTLGH